MVGSGQRCVIIGVTVSLLALGVVSPSAKANPLPARTFTTCKALNKVYPNGVTFSAAAARKAVSDGWRRPRVNARVFQANVRLDQDGNGVLCERGAPSVAPQAPPAPPAAPAWTPNDAATWSQPEIDYIRYRTATWRRLASADQLYFCRIFAEPAQDAATRSIFQDQADEGVRLFSLNPTNARLLVPHYYDRVCHLLFGLHTRIV